MLFKAKRAFQASQNESFTKGPAVERNEFKECSKEGFFIKGTCRQMKSGLMPTTTKLPEWVDEKLRLKSYKRLLSVYLDRSGIHGLIMDRSDGPNGIRDNL